MHIVEAKGILSAKNGMNLYRRAARTVVYTAIQEVVSITWITILRI